MPTSEYDAGYEAALDAVRLYIWREIAEIQRPKHIERKGLDRALDIIDLVRESRTTNADN